MALTDGNSPQVPGLVTAQSFVSTLVAPVNGTYSQGNDRYIPQTIKVITNGTTEVNVFAATNPVSGTFTGVAKIVSKDNANGNISLQHTIAGTVVFIIAKGSEGGVKGTFFPATAFTAGGTATLKSSTATGNAVVELDFIVSNPQLPGAQ